MSDEHAKVERLLSLDVMRGLVVAGMILVNSAAYVKALDGFDAYPILLHSEWAGFTLADFVFPAFIFMVGVSIALSLTEDKPSGLDREVLWRIVSRAARLFLVGLVISNLYWMADWTQNHFRVMGVLQRIGLCYFFTSVLYLCASRRFLLATAVTILVLYWPLTLIAMPDGHATDLTLPGANFVSWFDRAVLGSYGFVKGPLGFDPEGLLSTLPSIAQCLLGVLAGEWLLRNRNGPVAHWQLALGGLALTATGLIWSPFFPLIKSIWTSSYVLFSTGLAMILLALCYWAIDRRRWNGWWIVFFAAFGVNAIFDYVLHELASLMLAGDAMRWFDIVAAHVLPPQAAALVPVIVFVLIVWLPVYYLYRRNWIIRI